MHDQCAKKVMLDHKRPNLTIRGMDQILMIYVVLSETWLPKVLGVMLYIRPLRIWVRYNALYGI